MFAHAHPGFARVGQAAPSAPAAAMPMGGFALPTLVTPTPVALGPIQTDTNILALLGVTLVGGVLLVSLVNLATARR